MRKPLAKLVRHALERSPKENLTRLYFRLRPQTRSSVLHLATLDDWWRLGQKYPMYLRPNHTPLKDFGYLTILDVLDQHKPARVLEFGHGLWHSTAESLYTRTAIEFWACDDFHRVEYYPQQASEWEQNYEKFISQFPQTRFVKCLLGNQERTRELLPEGYFDLVCSVSVLEELQPLTLEQVLAHCHHLLKPTGRLLCSFDVRVRDYQTIENLIRMVRAANFKWEVNSQFLPYANWDTALLESQLIVMLNYQAHQGAARRYESNWTTIIVDAKKIG